MRMRINVSHIVHETKDTFEVFEGDAVDIKIEITGRKIQEDVLKESTTSTDNDLVSLELLVFFADKRDVTEDALLRECTKY